MSCQLDRGDDFPEIVVNTIDGRTLTLPDDLPGEYPALLFYRGWW